jgi:phytoene dehydrogenase-like protein
MKSSGRTDVVIVGGGLAGLTTAIYLGRAGRKVTVLERAHELGGRAMSRNSEGFEVNLGPHALYAGLAGERVLAELGVPFVGHKPPSSGHAILGGEKLTLPAGPFGLLATKLLGPRGKLDVARVLGGSLFGRDFSELGRTSVRTWLDREIASPDARAFVEALFRLSTFVNAPDDASAAVAISQLASAIRRGVYFLDGGWQTLVDGLARRARELGAVIELGADVTRIEREDRALHVKGKDGSVFTARDVVVAASPRAASALLGDDPDLATTRWAREARPVEAACLDLVLRSAPDPKSRFALGIDAPLYFSIHSGVARFAPHDGCVIHAAKYLDPNAPHDAAGDARELEALTDSMQPGWRDRVLERRFLPRMTVNHWLVSASSSGGGLASRPGPEVPGVRGLYVVGDWVGPEGWLADAAFASARKAAMQIVREGDLIRAA